MYVHRVVSINVERQTFEGPAGFHCVIYTFIDDEGGYITVNAMTARDAPPPTFEDRGTSVAPPTITKEPT